MKKVIIIVITVISLVAIYFLVKTNQDLEKVLSQFNNVQSDGFYDLKTNIEASGYIVSNKTNEGYRYGYVNYQGKILLKPEYNQLYRVMDIEDKNKIYIIAAKNGRYGVTLNGKTIINYEYQFIEYDGITEKFILQKSNKYGLANKKGETILSVENDSIEAKGIYIYVTKQDERKVYNKNAEVKEIDFNVTILPTENEEYYIKTVEENQNYFYGVVDKEEKEIIPTIYSYIEYMFENYFIVCNEENMQGIVDENNNIKIDKKYNLVQKIPDTNIIMVLDTENNITELYSKKIEKMCEMKKATVERESDENIIKIYNNEETKYFDINGEEIKK
jgi:hypothetical protein